MKNQNNMSPPKNNSPIMMTWKNLQKILKNDSKYSQTTSRRQKQREK